MRGEAVPVERPAPARSFDAFYRAEYPGAVRLALALTQWQDGSEDIVQESFAKVQPRFAGLERPGGYLRVTIVNQCREAERRRRREQRRLGRVAPAGVALPDDDWQLLDLLSSLDYRPRAVLVLRYWAGWSEAEIADALDCRPGTVKSLASRALARLRTELEVDDG